jgi:pimeloyl-ACP methyl ester carboxylesterase
MSFRLRALFAASLAFIGGLANATDSGDTPHATVVLVHGAFADGSSWYPVIDILQARKLHVVAFANPLRGPAWDSSQLSELLATLPGPVVLVGHSYGGAVISNAELQPERVVGLVFVAAFSPDVGETVGGLAQKMPGSTLGETLAMPVALGSGGNDLYIKQEKFPSQFAGDLPPSQSRIMAANQRPIRDAAFIEPVERANWHDVRSWAIYGSADKNIPPMLMDFMAKRAHATTVVLDGASHVPMLSDPQAVAELIVRASEAK